MSLRDELEEFTRDVIGRRGESEAAKLFEGQIETARALGIGGKALREGDRAPDFTLPDQKGSPLTLSTLLKSGPAILVFYRGGWCPYCNIQLRALNNSLPEISGLGGQLVAVSPELPDFTTLSEEQRKLNFPVLSDLGNEARAFGLVFAVSKEADTLLRKANINLDVRNGVDGRELPVPATFVIGVDGIIATSFLDIDYRSRPEPSMIVTALRRCAVSAD